MNIFKRLARWFNKPEPIEQAQQGIFGTSAQWWRQQQKSPYEEEMERQLEEHIARYYVLNHPETDPEDIEVKLVGEIIREEEKRL